MIENLRQTIVEMNDVIRQKYKAEIKGIFGSYTRSDFHADSDLDLLVDFDDGADLMDHVNLQRFLKIDWSARLMWYHDAHAERRKTSCLCFQQRDKPVGFLLQSTPGHDFSSRFYF